MSLQQRHRARHILMRQPNLGEPQQIPRPLVYKFPNRLDIHRQNINRPLVAGQQGLDVSNLIGDPQSQSNILILIRKRPHNFGRPANISPFQQILRPSDPPPRTFKLLRRLHHPPINQIALNVRHPRLLDDRAQKLHRIRSRPAQIHDPRHIAARREHSLHQPINLKRAVPPDVQPQQLIQIPAHRRQRFFLPDVAQQIRKIRPEFLRHPRAIHHRFQRRDRLGPLLQPVMHIRPRRIQFQRAAIILHRPVDLRQREIRIRRPRPSLYNRR